MSGTSLSKVICVVEVQCQWECKGSFGGGISFGRGVFGRFRRGGLRVLVEQGVLEFVVD